MVEELLAAVLPNVSQSRRLRELDREGIDVFQFDGEHAVTIAVQCKGFEREWRSDRVPSLLTEVRKFVRKAGPVAEYWLVLNRSIPIQSDRVAIENELNACVKSGKARVVRLLDLDKFLKHMDGLLSARFRQLVESAMQQLRVASSAEIAGTAYIDNVPFHLEGETDANVTSKIVAEISDYASAADPSHTGKYRRTPKYLVTGGFGFGKTTGLLHLAKLWAELGHDVYFVPAATLDADAYLNSAGLLEHLINQIADERIAGSTLAREMLRDACKKEFRTHYPLLLIDAIDESLFWQFPERLAALWRSLAELGNPVVVTVRDELYLSRPADFIFGSDAGSFRHITLDDWGPALMTEFLDAFSQARTIPAPTTFIELRNAVAAGHYHQLYGDIPRRPLFLAMLAEDAWAGQSPEKELHRLYGQYFRRKLARDWENTALPNRMVRATNLTRRFGREQAIEEVLWIMQNAATHIFQMMRTQGRADAWIEESKLKSIIEDALDESTIIEEVLLSSLLRPLPRDPLTRRRRYQFAHRSFFDWLVARAAIETNMDATQLGDWPAMLSFAASMREDLEAGRPLP